MAKVKRIQCFDHLCSFEIQLLPNLFIGNHPEILFPFVFLKTIYPEIERVVNVHVLANDICFIMYCFIDASSSWTSSCQQFTSAIIILLLQQPGLISKNFLYLLCISFIFLVFITQKHVLMVVLYVDTKEMFILIIWSSVPSVYLF